MNHIKTLKRTGIIYKVAVAFLDCVVILASVGLALFVRFEFSIAEIERDLLEEWFAFVPLQILITIIVFIAMRMYRFVWGSVSAVDFGRMVVSIIIANICSSFVEMLLHIHYSRSVLFMSLCFQIVGLIGDRFLFRIYNSLRHRMCRKGYEGIRSSVMIIGAGAAGRMLIREYHDSDQLNANVRCVIDDDPSKWGSYIDGIIIKGGRYEIANCVRTEEIDTIIFAIPTADAKTQSKILDICKETGCRLKKLPGIYQIVNGEVSLDSVKNVQVEDLLGRDPVFLDIDSMRSFINGKSIMVTGGGGSIGSELCRQIAKLSPGQLIILDIYENNAYEIQQELIRNYGNGFNLSVEIASVRDKEKIDQIFDKYRPNIVFHAAAHKHVPLMESCPSEAIKNNILGTWHVMCAAEKYGTRKFVEISSDKAVNPTNVMGATKRFCEMMLMSKKNSSTEYCAVRFGNVLGSNGSVVPLFKKQIEAGGPVTITDKRIIRYFMTIPEAAQLVLEAGSMAHSNQIFVLDMGEPVHILDLAENLIKLSGLQPGRDIEIREIGLRPGEKLYEELLMSSGKLSKTENKKIFIEEQEDIPEKDILEKLDILDKAVSGACGSTLPNDQLIYLLRQIVPTFKDPSVYNAGK